MPTGDPTLSACMIVRNEARFLEGCLCSIRDVVDEIVIGDTGSTDQTPEIARDFGARLYSIPWKHDFSAARNQVLLKAKGTWILSIDADERLRPTSRSHIDPFLKDPQKSACHVSMHPMNGWTGMWMIRLFRNDPRIRFKGTFHETIWDGLQNVLASDNQRIGYSDLALDHLGYDHDQEEKHKRNLPLLLREIQQDPNRECLWTHLGLVHQALGQDDLAEDAWKRAVELARKKQEPYLYGYVYYLEWKARHGQPDRGLLSEAMGRFPENPYLYWLKGRLLMDENRCDEAILFFESLLGWGQRRDFNRAFTYPRHIFDVNACDSLAVCNFQLANYQESGRYFHLAQKFSPDKAEYRIKQRLCESLMQDRAAKTS